MRNIITAVLGLSLLLGVAAPSGSVDKIYVLATGAVTVNGKPVTPAVLKSDLQQLKKSGGEVWFARENSQKTATKSQQDVFSTITQMDVPIRMFADKNFTKHARPPHP